MHFKILMMTPNVSIHLIRKSDSLYLQFDFTGHLDEANAAQAILQWKKEVANLPADTKVTLIYNCLSMTGFDTAARRIWQATLKELQTRTGVIWIVSDNLFIIGAAKTMSVLTRYTLKCVRSVEEVRP